MTRIKPLDSIVTIRECALKLLEEASEACEAMKAYDKDLKGWKYFEALEELADVQQCVCNCLYSIGASQADWEDAVTHVQLHNAERGRGEIEGSRTLEVTWRGVDDEQ